MADKKCDGGKFLIDAIDKLKVEVIGGEIYQAIEKLFIFCLEQATDMGVTINDNSIAICPVFCKLNNTKEIFRLESTGILKFEINRALTSADNKQKDRLNLLLEELKAIGIFMPDHDEDFNGDFSWVALVDDIILILRGFI